MKNPPIVSRKSLHTSGIQVTVKSPKNKNLIEIHQNAGLNKSNSELILPPPQNKELTKIKTLDTDTQILKKRKDISLIKDNHSYVNPSRSLVSAFDFWFTESFYRSIASKYFLYLSKVCK